MTSKVSITPTQAHPKINVSQYDVGREITFLLEENQQAYNVPSNSTVKLQGTKPSGFGFDIACTYSANAVTLITTNDLTAEAGNFPAELVITKSGLRIGTANLLMAVEASPHPTGTTDGNADEVIPELTLLVERVEEASSKILDMTVVADTLPAGSNATYSYDEETNTATFGIPRGRDGADGEVTFDALNGATAVQTLSDNTPYLFRQTVKKAHTENLDKVIGGSVAWNQLAHVLSQGVDNVSCTRSYDANTGVTTFTPTNYSASSIGFYTFANSLKSIDGHAYFVTIDINPDNAGSFMYGFEQNGYVTKSLNAGSYQTIATVKKPTQPSLLVLYLRNSNWASGTFKVKNYNVFDLTQMFGSTVADAIYAMEQATAGSGVAYFKSLGFDKPYYAYNAGMLKHVEGVSSHDTVGFNAWDEEWEVGGIDTSTGQNITANDRIRGKNYIEVVPNTTYYVKGNCNFRLYDADKNYISAIGTTTNNTFNIPNGIHYIRLVASASYGTTYKNDICINISDTAKNGTYEPYSKHSYQLDDSLTLRGIPKWDNGLYYDGDVYEPSGTVTRKYGIVDLGTLTWFAHSTSGRFYAQLSASANAKPAASTSATANIICAKYIASAQNQVDSSTGYISFDGSANPYVNIYDTTYSGSTASAFKTAMNGVYLVYELKTPTTETADPYQKGQVCDPNGTEEFVSTSIVPVGHETEYPQTLSDIKPTANGNYVLKCTVTNGVATYEWVSA